MKKQTLVTLLMLLYIGTGYSQYFDVSIDQKIAFSDCIVEGEVISQSTFRNRTDGYIYTQNKIKLSKVLAGQEKVNSDTVTILTRGGYMKIL